MAKKDKTWGSTWTDEKLDAFEKYVKAYLSIMKYNKDRYNWETIYFDGFAGSGDLGVADTSPDIKLLDFEDEETKLYKGSAERILQLDNKFNYYYFVDLNETSMNKLKVKLSPYNDLNPQFRQEDANKCIIQLSNALKKNKKYKALVLLDPFGMQINWESIESLKDTSSDIWILVPSGVIVNRLLDRKGELKSINKLCSFFGMTEDEIRKEFYEEKSEPSLFGEISSIEKKAEPIKKIAKLYIKRLKEIWENVIDEPLVLYNSKNVPIFHFVFASKNKTASNIAKDIIKVNCKK